MKTYVKPELEIKLLIANDIVLLGSTEAGGGETIPGSEIF